MLQGSSSLAGGNILRYLDDLHGGDRYDLGTVTVSGEQSIEFARHYDPQAIHLDGKIVSGWHVASLFMRLYVDQFLSRTASDVSPGLDELRWLLPVQPGDVLSGTVTIGEISASLSKPACGIVRQYGQLTDPSDRPVMSIVFYGLIHRR